MATKKGKQPTAREIAAAAEALREAQEIEEGAEAGTPLDAGGIENIYNQLGQLPGEAKVYVYRMRRGVRPPFAFLYGTTAAQFDIEDVQARYGGGDYFMRAWQRGVSGALVNEHFSIEGEPRVPTPAPVPVNGAQGPTFLTLPGQPGQGDAISALGQMMRDTVREIAQLVVRPQGNSIEETLRLVSLVKALSNEGNQLGTIKEIMGIIREAQPLTGEGGQADAWSVFQTVAEKIAPVLVSAAVQRGPQLPAPAPAAQPAPPAALLRPMPGAPTTLAEAAAQAANAPHAPAPAPAPGGNGAELPPAVRAMLEPFINAARLNADPGVYAQLILDQLDGAPQYEDAIRTFLMAPDWLDKLGRADARVAGLAPWFTRLHGELLGALDSAGEEDLTGAEGGGISDPEGDPYAPREPN
jgi:hypothetical protein